MQDSKLRLEPVATGKAQPKGTPWLGWAGGVLAQLCQRRRLKVTPQDLRCHDYRTSTQRLGVRFTERVRHTFRFRWLRKMR